METNQCAPRSDCPRQRLREQRLATAGRPLQIGVFPCDQRQHQADFRACGHTRYGWRQRKALLRRLVPFGAEPDMEIMEILDIGCGNGRMGNELCQVLQQRGITTQIDGIDFTERATQIAQTTFGYRETFIADCTDIQAHIRLQAMHLWRQCRASPEWSLGSQLPRRPV